MDTFAAIADPIRRDLLRALAGGPARVVDLAAAHPVSRPAISRHLRLLGEAGLVAADERGRENHYRLVPGPLGEVAGFLRELEATQERRAATAPSHPAGPPVTPSALDALDTEVRRTARDRRSGRTSSPTPSTREETA